jgi:galactonate dehydratase
MATMAAKRMQRAASEPVGARTAPEGIVVRFKDYSFDVLVSAPHMVQWNKEMKITDVRTVQLSGSSTCIRVDTDEGVRGYGEASVETSPESVIATVHRIAKHYLVGQDPVPIELHRRRLQDAFWYHEGVNVNSAMSGIEQALWDIKGKVLGVPVYELLGGPVRDRVRVYKWIGARTREGLAEQALRVVAQGITAIKFSPTPPVPSPYPRCVPEAIRIVREVREAVGPDIDIMLDPAGRWKLAEAKHILAELEPFTPLFAEDFISPYHIRAVEKLAASTRIPYALGDRFFRFRQFEEVLHRDAAAVLQPDICHAGGLSEIKLIAGASEHHGIRLAPHNPHGPIATAAVLHLDLAIPNFLIQEIAGTDFFGAWSLEKFMDIEILEIKNGHIAAPRKPGLGVSVADELFENPPDVCDAPFFVDGGDFHVPEW